MIDILYQSPWPLGGSTSYVAHLARCLGSHANVLRLGARTEKNLRTHALGFQYQILSIDDLCARGRPLLLAAGNPKMDHETTMRLLNLPHLWRVFHDPNELELYPYWHDAQVASQVICVRETGLDTIPNGHFVPHPYVSRRAVVLPPHERRAQHAISLARTCKLKNSHLILAANQKLAPIKRVRLYGAVERWFKQDYPEVTDLHPCGYPREPEAGVQLLMQARNSVDLTVFRNDGGGTQYTFLESLDAGCRIIAHSDWNKWPGPMRDLSVSVSTSDELVEALNDDDPHNPSRGLAYLYDVHGPTLIAAKYAALMQG